MSAMETVIFESINVRAVLKKFGDSHRRLMVSFQHWAASQRLERGGFGESLFIPREIDCLYITCASNSWWQYPEMPDVLAAIAKATSRWREVVTYGSSMGGYAAFRFAAELRATRAVAFAPQFSINRNLAVFENRWGAEHSSIKFMHEHTFTATAECEYVAIFDPYFDLDRKHIRFYQRFVPVTEIKLRCAGHPPLDILAEFGILSEFTLQALQGDLDLKELRATERAKRRFSSQYWKVLARRLSERRSWSAMERAGEYLLKVSPDRAVATKYLETLRRAMPLSAVR